MNVFPPKIIVVAFDFSNRSMQAWRYAGGLARRLRASLRVIYVAPLTFLPEGPPILPLNRAERLALAERLRRRLGGKAEGRVTEGDIVGGILTEAREAGADLIVMATSGRTGLSRAVVGSITEAVARLSPIPVLSLRRAAALPRRVLAPVNLKSYSMAGYHMAEAASKALGARLTLLYVREGRDDKAASVRLSLAAEASRSLLHLPVKTKLVEGRPVPAILKEAADHDLLVLVAHRRGILRDGLLGTTAEQVLRRCPVPVLCVPAPQPAPRRSAVRRHGGMPRQRAAASIWRERPLVRVNM
ncbi:MAG: universal stress protein [Elusimicrobia bacterium]|nr:universal stress protein [Elusimicrobiota bacterium]MDE2424779.1 universal stress protein [Elusimicrobiota bacterium]